MIAIPEKVAQLAGDDQTKTYQALQQLLDSVSRAGGRSNESEQKAVAAALAAELTAKREEKQDNKTTEKPKHPVKVRRTLCQLLAQVAGDDEVPALAAELKDLETREMARWALQRIPTAAATRALVVALDSVGPEFRIGVINALAKRPTPEALAALHRQAADPDEEVRLAAVEALSGFPEASCDDTIAAAAAGSGAPRSKSRVHRARIRLAENLHRAGNKEVAISVYRSILGGDAGEPQKKAARLGLEQLT